MFGSSAEDQVHYIVRHFPSFFLALHEWSIEFCVGVLQYKQERAEEGSPLLWLLKELDVTFDKFLMPAGDSLRSVAADGFQAADPDSVQYWLAFRFLSEIENLED